MTTAVIGATGHVGSEVVRGVLRAAIKQVTRLSVLNTSTASLGINQRAHYSIDEFASATAVPYSTIRPAIFSLSLLAAAREVRASRTWTGLTDSGRMALIDHRDVAAVGVRVLAEPAFWGAHHDLTGPVAMSWLEALAARDGTRRTRHLPGRGRAAVPRPRGTGGNSAAAHRARVVDPRRRERLHDRHLPAGHRPPPAPAGRVRSRAPRESSDPTRHRDAGEPNGKAGDVTLEGSMLDGAGREADAFHALVGGARQLCPTPAAIYSAGIAPADRALHERPGRTGGRQGCRSRW